jgi:hypothetical protein
MDRPFTEEDVQAGRQCAFRGVTTQHMSELELVAFIGYLDRLCAMRKCEIERLRKQLARIVT